MLQGFSTIKRFVHLQNKIDLLTAICKFTIIVQFYNEFMILCIVIYVIA